MTRRRGLAGNDLVDQCDHVAQRLSLVTLFFEPAIVLFESSGHVLVESVIVLFTVPQFEGCDLVLSHASEVGPQLCSVADLQVPRLRSLVLNRPDDVAAVRVNHHRLSDRRGTLVGSLLPCSHCGVHLLQCRRKHSRLKTLDAASLQKGNHVEDGHPVEGFGILPDLRGPDIGPGLELPILDASRLCLLTC